VFVCLRPLRYNKTYETIRTVLSKIIQSEEEEKNGEKKRLLTLTKNNATAQEKRNKKVSIVGAKKLAGAFRGTFEQASVWTEVWARHSYIRSFFYSQGAPLHRRKC